MLQDIRSKTQGWITWVIIIVICVTFALWGIGYYLNGSSVSGSAVAKVGDQSISKMQLSQAYNNLRQQSKNVVDPKTLQKQALETLIMQSVMLQGAKHAGLGVGETQVNNAIYQMKVFQENGKFSETQLMNVLARMGQNTSELQVMLAHQILLTQLQMGLVGTSFVLPQELNLYESALTATRDVSYMVLPLTQFSKVPSRAEVSQYYRAHPKMFMTEPKVSIEYLLLSQKSVEGKVHVTDAQIRAYYAQNPSLAKKSLASVRGNIQKTLVKQQAEHLYATLGNKMANMTFEDPNSLQSTAQALGLKVQHTGLFTQAGAASGMAKNPKVVQAAFGDEVLGTGNNSNIINVTPTEAMVLRVKHHDVSHVLSLADVKTRIQGLLSAEDAATAAVHLGEQSVKSLHQGTALSGIAAAHKTKLQHVILRYGRKASSDLTTAAFMVSVPTATLASPGYTISKTHLYIFNVTKASKGKALDAKKREAFKKDMVNTIGESGYAQFVAALKAKTKVIVK
jgi:peptidyl-prolyl cis-trans isomerase D